MKRIRYSAVMMLLVIALVVAACGGGGTASTPAASGAQGAAATDAPAAQAPAATDAPAGGAATAPAGGTGGTSIQLLGWSSSDAENEQLNQMIQEFNQSQSQYQAQFNPVPEYDTTLQTALAGGSPPDVFYLDSNKFPDFIANNVLMTPPDGAIEDPGDFYESLAGAFTSEGALYCPPKGFSTLGLVYNKTMFDEAGVAVPTTWEELRAAAEKLTNKDQGVYGMALPADAARWLAFLYQAGGQVLTEDRKMNINTPEAKQALEYYTGLIADGFAATPDQVDAGWPGEALGKQRVAMVVEGNWIVPFLQRDFPDVEFAVAELPAGPGGKATLAFTVCYAVAKNAKDPAGSWALVNALTDKEGMKTWTDLGLEMPTRKSLRDGWVAKFPDLQPFLAGADYARPWQFAPGFQPVIDAINGGIQQIGAGQATVDQVLENAQSAGEDVLGR